MYYFLCGFKKERWFSISLLLVTFCPLAYASYPPEQFEKCRRTLHPEWDELVPQHQSLKTGHRTGINPVAREITAAQEAQEQAQAFAQMLGFGDAARLQDEFKPSFSPIAEFCPERRGDVAEVVTVTDAILALPERVPEIILSLDSPYSSFDGIRIGKRLFIVEDWQADLAADKGGRIVLKTVDGNARLIVSIFPSEIQRPKSPHNYRMVFLNLPEIKKYLKPLSL